MAITLNMVAMLGQIIPDPLTIPATVNAPVAGHADGGDLEAGVGGHDGPRRGVSRLDGGAFTRAACCTPG